MATSLDGAHLALLRDAELTLYTVEPLAVVARVSIPGELAADPTVVFVGRQIAVHGNVGGRSRLTVLTTPKLALVSQLELEAPTRFVAHTHGYVLLDAGAQAYVITCTATAAAVAPLRVDVTVEHAIGCETPQFITWSNRGGEVWDAASRRPESRIAIGLPRGTTAIGLTAQQRSMWTASPTGLSVCRLSDGRTLAIPVSGQPERVTSHPQTSWLVCDIAGAVHAVNVALRSVSPLEVPNGLVRALAPMAGADTDAYLIVDEGDRLSRHQIAVDAARDRHRGLSLQLEPIGRAPEPEPVPPPPSPLIEAPRASSVAERLAARAPKPGAPPPPRPSQPPTAPTSQPATRILRAAPSITLDWRDALVTWAKAVLGNAPTEALPSGGSPLARLAERAELTAGATRILHVLYADWLAGKGDVGVAAATLAPIGGPDAWSEALGAGRLAHFGLAMSESGRCTLARAVGAFLDGRTSRTIELCGVDEPGPLPEGVFRVAADGETARARALAFASSLGQVAFSPFPREEPRLDAWLRERPLISAYHHDAIDPRPGETILLVAPPGTDDDGGPPWWRDAAE